MVSFRRFRLMDKRDYDMWGRDFRFILGLFEASRLASRII